VRSFVLGIGLWAASLRGADIDGIWIGEMLGRNGQAQEIAFKFTQKGAKLEGKMYGAYQSTPISEGTISGELLTFTLHAQEQTGNQINESRIRFTGRLKNGEMELFRERETSTNAGNGGTVNLQANSKQTCHLKRLP
jgi:hypothetical protein